MRKFGLFLCLSLLFAFTGCSDSDDVEEQGGTVLAKPSVAECEGRSRSRVLGLHDEFVARLVLLGEAIFVTFGIGYGIPRHLEARPFSCW